MYLTIFRNGRTAVNYVGYIKWVCFYSALDTKWYDEQLQMAMKGLKKLTAEQSLENIKEKWKLSSIMFRKVVRLADALGLPFGDLAVMSWHYLLRVQSEGIDLEWGEAADLVSLPSGRHSAFFTDLNDKAHLRLRRRKHRPGGSLLTRFCTCKELRLLRGAQI